MVVSVQLVPFWASFHWRKASGLSQLWCPVGGRSRPRWWSSSLYLGAIARVASRGSLSDSTVLASFGDLRPEAHLYIDLGLCAAIGFGSCSNIGLGIAIG